jgi:Zn-finger nucleic acid-binding protein
MMNRVNFGKISGTVIDVCRGHGTFLDASELHQIVEFIEKGGLDRARAQKAEEMREQERRLRSLEQKATAKRGAKAATSWGDGADTGLGVVDLIAMIMDR